jgi:hypothetical protein
MTGNKTQSFNNASIQAVEDYSSRILPCVNSGFRRRIKEIFGILECYAAYIGS